MPTITIDGRELEFEQGQTILQVALDHDIEIPHYCYHPSLSIVANCRICLAEVWAPNPRNEGKLEYLGKLVPTCQQGAINGAVVYTDSPRAIANQKAVMEYLLINHPVDCAVCDQAGECHLQDYSYQYGRGQARFMEQKIKQPKKDVGPYVLLYADRCIMCTRCVRFTREVTGTSELIVEDRGAHSQIDLFPGLALDNPLSGNVIDICPVGALLDKDFLFQQRVWYLKKTPSIDGITASGDNISIEHNQGQVWRIKPRTNMEVNKWWITDEVRYGWKFVHDENRLTMPRIRGEDPYDEVEAPLAYEAAYQKIEERMESAEGVALLVSPMLSCEDAYLLANYALLHDENAVLGVGPVPVQGEDQVFPGAVAGALNGNGQSGGFKVYAEKAPNARGVRRVLEKLSSSVHDYDGFMKALGKEKEVDTVILTGNYPSEWVTEDLEKALGDRFVVLIDTLPNRVVVSGRAEVLLPGATWVEKSGTFENAIHRLQSFHRAIEPLDFCKGESQIALDLIAAHNGDRPARADPEQIRRQMANVAGMTEFLSDVHHPPQPEKVKGDMEVVEL